MKEPADPLVPKKRDVIVLSGRKERCEAAIEALKVTLVKCPSVHAVVLVCMFMVLCQML